MKFRQLIYKDAHLSRIDWLVDVILAAGIFGFGLLQITVMAGIFYPDDFTRLLLGGSTDAPTVSLCAAVFLTCIPLVFRQHLPWPAFLISAACWFASNLCFDSSMISIVAPLALMFTVAYICGRAQGIVAAVIMAALVVAVYFLTPTGHLSVLFMMQNLELVLAVALGGLAFSAHQRYLNEMQARLEQAELTREKEAQRRVEEERLRIAREIHDITAHSLSAVNVQANLALRLIDANPEAAKNSVEAISKTSKQALAEMRGVVGAMRAGASDAPTQGMSAVDALADYLRAAGLECTVNNNGYASDSVPAYIDLALFGITREAVTNVVRHAQATRATITFGINENKAYVEVVDNGIGATSPEGNGILGMRERASVFGGTFSVTPNNDARGGTTVFAQLPIK